MSTLSGGPNIITDSSLVLYLDAANNKSYISGSTTWNDISRAGNTGTLLNGIGYTSSYNGELVFNGTNQYASIPNNALLNTDATPFTVEMCIKLPSNVPASSQYLYSKLNNSFVLYLYNNLLYMGKDIVNDWANVSIAPYLNNNLYITAGWDGTNKFCYLNGVNVINSVQSTFLIASTSNPLYLAGIGNTSFSGSMYLVRNYNRALTSQEILQNFNATRARFGI